MSKPIIAIRPEPGLSATVAAGSARGLSIAGWSLSRIEPLSWDLPSFADFDALLIGSANALRHGGDKLNTLKSLPVYAVGQATADLAERQGFSIAQTGEGGLQHLLDQLKDEDLCLLRLSGQERVDLEVGGDITITERAVYRVEHLPINENEAAMLHSGAIVMLYSAASAAHFAKECDRHAVDRNRIAIAALGPRILDAVGSGWADAKAAPRPRTSDLLALAEDMCQGS